MTYDVIALLDKQPSKDDLLAGLAGAGTDWGVRAVSGGAVLQLCDDDGQPVISIDSPSYIQVPGEPARLLGPDLAGVPCPVWWVEVRATGKEGASQVAWRYADALVDRLGGRIWAPPPPPLAPPLTEGGTADA
jgi:hypothetical protein